MASKKILYILRHAKTESGSAGQDDHDRALIPRGEEAARIMGEYIAKRFRPDKVLCSTAKRSKQTWLLMQEAYLKPPPVEYTEKLYLTSEQDILKLLSHLPETVSSILIVGHNPSLHQLCLKLARKGDGRLLDTVTMKFPTCAFAAIGFNDINWWDIADEEGTLMAFISPKMISAEAEE